MKELLLIASVMQLMLLSSCTIFGVTTLEFQKLQDFSLIEERKGNDLNLRISGMSGSSALGIKRIDVVSQGDELIVKPRMVLAGGGHLSASFDFTVSVPPNIKRVLFGEEGYEIWPVIPPSTLFNRTPWLKPNNPGQTTNSGASPQ